MKYTIAIGAVALIIIATVPALLTGIWHVNGISFLGTSIIITVGVILDTKKQIQTESLQTNYTEKIKKGGLFGA